MDQITLQAHSNLVGGSTAARRRKAIEVTVSEVRLLLDYDPATGRLCWRHRDVSLFSGNPREADIAARKWNSRHAGRPALNSLSNGYLTGHINYTQVYAHKIAWLHHYGYTVPKGMYVDHVNGDRSDNRIANLRVVTPRQSMFNMPPRGIASSYKGVKYDKRRGHWYARIRVEGVDVSLGRFSSEDAAAEAYKRAAETYQGAHAYHISREGNSA